MLKEEKVLDIEKIIFKWWMSIDHATLINVIKSSDEFIEYLA